MRAAVTALACLAIAGCAPDPEVSNVQLSLASVPSCAQGRADALSIRALGDFPAHSEKLDPARDAIALDDFPFASRVLGFDATFPKQHASALVLLDEIGMAPAPQRPVLLLPEARSCPLGDPFALALPGAAVTALSHGGLLIAGGQGDDGRSVFSALVLAPGAQLVEQVRDGMLLRRAYASASASGDWVVVAGGAADEGATAEETYEVYSAASGEFLGERSQRLVTGPRMQHGAATLRDGRVLIVGGTTRSGGVALASAELIEPESGAHAATRGSLQVARIAPTVLALDDGSVVVLGGRDDSGALVTSLERFDARTRTFSTLRPQLPAYDELACAALPGGRAAVLGCNVTNAKTKTRAACELDVLLPGGEDRALLMATADLSTLAPHALRKLRLLALDDGRLLVTGEDPVAVIARRALVVDLGKALAEKREASRVPSELLRLADGSIVELDAFGTSLRRELSRSAYDDAPGNLLSGERTWLALDAAARWRADADTLTAELDDARLAFNPSRWRSPARVARASCCS
jgi:hypothetical protein